VFTVGATKAPINTNMNLTITPRYSFADAPKPDVLLTPCGDIGDALRWGRQTQSHRARTAGRAARERRYSKAGDVTQCKMHAPAGAFEQGTASSG
jgi:hypothetical protein